MVCNCLITEGANITVTGSGAPGNPFVISSSAPTLTFSDTATLDLNRVGDDVTGFVKLDPAAGNLITPTANGLLVDCTDVASCFVAGNGIDPALLAAGSITTCLSTDVGNTVTFGTDGCLFSSGIAMSVVHGCGLLGNGTAANPLFVDVNGTVWPYPCAETFGGKVYCDSASNGLVVDPEKFMVDEYFTNHIVGTGPGTSFPANTDASSMSFFGSPVAVPIGNIVNFVLNNPSSCRALKVRFEVGFSHLSYRAISDVANQPPGGGRINTLFGAMLASTGGIVIGVGTGQCHQAWEYAASQSFDITWDVTSSNYLSTLFTLAAGASATLALQATIRIINDLVDTDPVADWSIFARVTGYNI